jgi:hypothetical protein
MTRGVEIDLTTLPTTLDPEEAGLNHEISHLKRVLLGKIIPSTDQSEVTSCL